MVAGYLFVEWSAPREAEDSFRVWAVSVEVDV
jgi:hypothetical protein